MSNYTVQQNISSFLNLNSLFIADGWTVLPDNTLRHASSKTTKIYKTYNELELGITYTISVIISNHVSCSLKVKVGNYISNELSTAGLHTFNVELSGNRTIEFIGNGYFDVTGLTILKTFTNFTKVDFTNPNLFENKGFTVSYDPLHEKWISYHSYIPKLYLQHPNKFLIVNDTRIIKISDSDTYFSQFILETVFNDDPLLTKTFNSISVNSECYQNNKYVNKFFSNLVLYNDDQLSGDVLLDSIHLTRKEKDYHINKFSDLSLPNNKQNLFNSDWLHTKDNYYIDKRFNEAAIDTNKAWYTQGRFRNKYLVARFIDNNFDNKKLIVNFVNTIYRPSQR